MDFEKLFKEAKDGAEKSMGKEMPPDLEIDTLFENCSDENIKDTIARLQAVLMNHPEAKATFKERLRWAKEEAQEKMNYADSEERGRAFHRLQLLTKIAEDVNSSENK